MEVEFNGCGGDDEVECGMVMGLTSSGGEEMRRDFLSFGLLHGRHGRQRWVP